jgi:hypothetical protein
VRREKKEIEMENKYVRRRRRRRKLYVFFKTQFSNSQNE